MVRLGDKYAILSVLRSNRILSLKIDFYSKNRLVKIGNSRKVEHGDFVSLSVYPPSILNPLLFWIIAPKSNPFLERFYHRN